MTRRGRVAHRPLNLKAIEKAKLRPSKCMRCNKRLFWTEAEARAEHERIARLCIEEGRAANLVRFYLCPAGYWHWTSMVTPPRFIVFRIGKGTPPAVVPKGMDGLWINRPTEPAAWLNVDMAHYVARATWRTEQRADGEVAQVYEIVRNPS